MQFRDEYLTSTVLGSMGHDRATMHEPNGRISDGDSLHQSGHDFKGPVERRLTELRKELASASGDLRRLQREHRPGKGDVSSSISYLRKLIIQLHSEYQQLTGMQHPNSTSEEVPMSRHNTGGMRSREDEIFEAMIDGTFTTCSIQFDGAGQGYSYRVRLNEKVEVGDTVVVEANDTLRVATVVEIDETPNEMASAWVVQVVSMEAHLQRQEQWKIIRDGVNKTEMKKKKAALMGGYMGEMEQFAPAGAIEALRALPRTADSQFAITQAPAGDEGSHVAEEDEGVINV